MPNEEGMRGGKGGSRRSVGCRWGELLEGETADVRW